MIRYLNFGDRLKIAKLLDQKITKKEIAQQLDITRRTLYTELERGADSEGKYNPSLAQKKFTALQKNKGSNLKIQRDPELYEYLRKKVVEEHLSPEAIIREMKATGKDKESSISISEATLYAYISTGIFGE